MIPVTIDLTNLCDMQMADAEGRMDIIGHCLHAEGVPIEMLRDHMGPADLAYSVLILQKFPEAKDTIVGKLNRLIKPNSDFENVEQVTWLAKLGDNVASDLNNVPGDDLAELFATAYEIGYKLTFHGAKHDRLEQTA